MLNISTRRSSFHAGPRVFPAAFSRAAAQGQSAAGRNQTEFNAKAPRPKGAKAQRGKPQPKQRNHGFHV
jgi:hypothetical protein